MEIKQQIFRTRDENNKSLHTGISSRRNIGNIKKNIEEQLKPSAPFRGILIVSQSVLYIPDICHFFYTGKISRNKILHPKVRK